MALVCWWAAVACGAHASTVHPFFNSGDFQMSTDLQLRLVVVFLVLALSALSLSTLHWFPWPTRLKRIEAYALGVVVLLGVPVGAMVITHAAGLMYGQLFWAGLLVANAIVGGTTVILAYAVDKRRPLNLEDVHRGPKR
jgi:hypothetical protein